MMKRGQAALEFLTTYGWAFLVILVMIGALVYFGVLRPENFQNERCVAGSPLFCNQQKFVDSTSGGYGTTDYFQVRLRNGQNALYVQNPIGGQYKLPTNPTASNCCDQNGQNCDGRLYFVQGGGIVQFDATNPTIPAQSEIDIVCFVDGTVNLGAIGEKKRYSMFINYAEDSISSAYPKTSEIDVFAKVQ
ncbi:MAG: hypothetical protein QXG00_03240 [Candidatus Woesearchaeota archaeon]